MVFFSIIIPTFNSESFVHRSIESILCQKFSNFEILILDGVSSDNTIDKVKSFNDLRIRLFSEYDNGVYDAMNKAIKYARGKWLLFLGSDDRLYNEDVLMKMFSELKKTSKSVVYGDTELEGHVSWAKGDKIYGGKFTLYRLLRRNICHQAIFYKRDFLVTNKLAYSISYPVSADWDLNLRAWLIHPFQYYPGIISYFSAGGISSGGREDDFQQVIPVLYKKYINNPYKHPIARFMFKLYNIIRRNL